MSQPALRVSAAVLGAPDANALARFYARFLGWPIAHEEPGWVMLRPPGGGMGLSFQQEDHYVPPLWPAGPGDQQMMVHLDIGAGDVERAVERAVELGATVAGHQPQPGVRVMLDPAGHPFCLFADPG